MRLIGTEEHFITLAMRDVWDVIGSPASCSTASASS